LTPTTGQMLRLVRWETEVRPDRGDDPQDVVNGQVRAADITIVVFWKRMGTPTMRAEAGTVEEFCRAVTAARKDPRREVLTYFKTALIDLHNEDLRQAEKVKAFRRRIASTTLDCEFRTAAAFESKVSRHLIDAALARARHVADQPAAEGQDRVVADYVRGLLARRYGEPADALRFRLAAEQSHVSAIVELASMLRERQEPDEADKWFRVAAAQGDAMAAYRVGLCLKERDELWPMRDWLRRGAEGGDVAAMYNLGLLLGEGYGDDDARIWLECARGLGHPGPFA
jgi:hypothetical protein